MVLPYGDRWFVLVAFPGKPHVWYIREVFFTREQAYSAVIQIDIENNMDTLGFFYVVAMRGDLACQFMGTHTFLAAVDLYRVELEGDTREP